MTYPTPEEIKQIASDCCFAYSRRGDGVIECPSDEELESFFTRAYELGWKNRGESDADMFDGQYTDSCPGTNISKAIRNNTGE